MKKTLIAFIGLSVLLLSGATTLKAQDLLTEVYVKENIPYKKPVPYSYVRESDVMWSKTIWRIIDLREKMNLPLYYPTNPIGNRMSLIDVLMSAIKDEGVTAYSTADELNEFKNPMNQEDLNMAFDAGVDTIKTQDVNTGQLETKIIPREPKTDEVKQILVKEKWFFDKQTSTMKVRIIGICPIRIYVRKEEVGNPDAAIQKKKTFWVYYPEVRNVLASHEIYNRHNDAQRISFDDFFWQRRFASYIFAESNVYDNRSISNYTSGKDALYESDRIKDAIFNMEQDLWQY